MTSYLIKINDIVNCTESIIARPTNFSTYIDDFKCIFEHIDISNVYCFDLDEDKHQMTIFKTVDKVSKGWIYNTKSSCKTLLYTLNLIKTNPQLASVLDQCPLLEEVPYQVSTKLHYEPDRVLQDFQRDLTNELKLKFTQPNLGLAPILSSIL